MRSRASTARCSTSTVTSKKASTLTGSTLVFNYSRHEVQSFLLSSAICWLEDFHFDGLRVDAVASMLYLDYSRKHGEWSPNVFGGNENLEAIVFLKRLNETTHAVCPGSITVAEESTAWPQVSRPTYSGGLGFTFKWNMGWMHDTLSYVSKDPVHRRFHHNLLTFGPIYVFTENFVCRCRTTRWCTASARCSTRCRATIGSGSQTCVCCSCSSGRIRARNSCSWAANSGNRASGIITSRLSWHLAFEGLHGGVRALVKDLNRTYRSVPALHRLDHEGAGFSWLSWQDDQHSVLGYVRKNGDAHVVVILNFTPVPRHGYRVGVPAAGGYREILNSDSAYYGGSNLGNGFVATEPVACMGHAQSIVVTLPPLGGILLTPG